jgi:glycosyltransferase involved in cell wall biosynthesis
MTGPPFVTVFTMTYNQRLKILNLARDLAVQEHPSERLEFVVLDDGSGDGTATALEDLARHLPYRLRLLRRSHEAHYLSAARWNECIAAASPETSVLIQVDDVRVRPDFVRAHAAWHAGRGLMLVTGSKFEGDTETWDLVHCRRAHLAAQDGGSARTRAWTACWGASMSYPRELTDRLMAAPFDGPFDTRMSGWGYHEVEFAFRALRAGAELVYDPAVGVFHQNHTPANDQGRGLDHAEQKKAAEGRNVAYLLDKHGLQALPGW